MMKLVNQFKVSGIVDSIGGCYGDDEAVVHLCVSSSSISIAIGIKKGVSMKNIKVGDTVTLIGKIKGCCLVATEIKK